MPVTSISAASLTPAHTATVKRTPSPRQVITAAPFTPKAQKQADAINTGRQPHRGNHVDIKV